MGDLVTDVVRGKGAAAAATMASRGHASKSKDSKLIMHESEYLSYNYI